MTSAIELFARGELPPPEPDRQLQRDSEIDRILSLPRKIPVTDEDARAMSRWLRRYPDDPRCPDHHPTDCKVCGNTGEIWLRPGQAQALRELHQARGLIGAMRVGEGKTLVMLLASTVMGAKNPIMILPADLEDKTIDDFGALAKAWHVRLPETLTSQALSRKTKTRYLFEKAPDLLIEEEAHIHRSLETNAAAVRVERYCREHRPIRLVMSGTLITSEIEDYQHHVVGTLFERAPMPIRPEDCSRWSQALKGRTLGLGALQEFPGGYHQWLRDTQGVVVLKGSGCDASLNLRAWRPTIPPGLAEMIRLVEETGFRPDGEILDEFGVADCVSSLALGLWHRWDPLPPDWWLLPRRAWNSYLRAVKEQRIEGYETDDQIRSAVIAAGKGFATEYDPPPGWRDGFWLWQQWAEVRHRFEPNPEPVWVDPSIMVQAADRARQGDPCVIWTRYRAPGEALETLGIPYYGAGTNPEQAPKGQTIVAGMSHRRGKNLQYGWRRALLLSLPAKPDPWEQLMGRFHRPGQVADEVDIEYIQAVEYHARVIERVRAEAASTSSAQGFDHKLLEATWIDKQ